MVKNRIFFQNWAQHFLTIHEKQTQPAGVDGLQGLFMHSPVHVCSPARLLRGPDAGGRVELVRAVRGNVALPAVHLRLHAAPAELPRDAQVQPHDHVQLHCAAAAEAQGAFWVWILGRYR